MQYLIPAILTAAFTFLVGFLLWQMKKERMSLEYDWIESEEFPREKGVGRYFIFKLINSGNKPIQDTKLTIDFPVGVIETANFSDPKLCSDLVIEKSQLSGMIPLLNPKENLGVTITTIGDLHISFPKIVARAVGTTAVPKKKDAISPHFLNLILAVLAAGVGIVAFLWWTSYKQAEVSKSLKTLVSIEHLRDLSKTELLIEELGKQRADLQKENKEQEQGKPETQQIVFAILNRVGLGHLMYRLIETGESVTYWKTGLVLMQAFLVDQENSSKYINGMKSIVELSDIAPSSLGFNLYLLGKMEQFRGNNESATKYFEKCKTRTPLMYEHLMGQDPTFNLESLRKWMLKRPRQ
jgi:hypothetical protein